MIPIFIIYHLIYHIKLSIIDQYKQHPWPPLIIFKIIITLIAIKTAIKENNVICTRATVKEQKKQLQEIVTTWQHHFNNCM
jgi:hypothetical protein